MAAETAPVEEAKVKPEEPKVEAEEPAKAEVKAEVKAEEKPVVEVEVKIEEKPEEVKSQEDKPPTIYIDTKPSVSFSNEHVMFDSTNLESNEINTQPFAEAENREDEDEDEDEEDMEESIKITDEVLQMDADEDLSEDRAMPIEFETLA